MEINKPPQSRAKNIQYSLFLDVLMRLIIISSSFVVFCTIIKYVINCLSYWMFNKQFLLQTNGLSSTSISSTDKINWECREKIIVSLEK